MKKKKGIQITDRDRVGFLWCYNADGCGLQHLYWRVYTDISYSVFGKRMSKLISHGYYNTKPVPNRSGIGNGRYFLTLSGKARYELRRLVGKYAKLRPSRNSAPYHHFELCDFKCRLEQSLLRRTDIQLLRWTPERDIHRINRRRQDANFELKAIGYDPVTFRVELDRGTEETPTEMIERLVAYMHSEDRSPVLWVVPDQKRAAKLTEWALLASERSGGDPILFWITTAGSDPLGDVWQVVGGPSNARLTP